MNDIYFSYVKCIQSLKDSGIKKNDALNCLEFDSDEYPDMVVLKKALEAVYG